MAIGMITVGEQTPTNGPQGMDMVSFPGDASYPTGGTAAFQASIRTALDKGNVNIVAIVPQDCGGYSPVYDNANDKLKVYHGDSDGVADGPMVQVPNATNLGAVTFNMLVIWY